VYTYIAVFDTGPQTSAGIHAVPISISVRHHLDPYLFAFAFSDSKFTFGHTMHQNFVESLVLMAIGSAILAPLLCMVIYSASDKAAVEAEVTTPNPKPKTLNHSKLR